jgi:hypothetical protein
MRKSIIILALVLLWISPAFSDDTVGANYHFSHADATGTKSALSINPETGPSYTFDSGNTLNADGSMTYRFGNDDGNGVVIRSEPAYDD